jgi:hypothetical protein
VHIDGSVVKQRTGRFWTATAPLPPEVTLTAMPFRETLFSILRGMDHYRGQRGWVNRQKVKKALEYALTNRFYLPVIITYLKS